MNSFVTLVDVFGNKKGEMEKLEAHKKGVLHEAYSIFIIKNGKMLLQKRAKNKYHSGGLWSNACCSHPQLNENIFENIKRKTYEEIGAEIENLTYEFSFVYRCKFENNVIEYEYDNVFVATTNSEIKINVDEVEKVKWIDLNDLAKDLEANPQKYSYWFLISCPKIIKKYLKK